ncbi:MAG: hypothetical protein ACYTG0_41745 [Planctomycetota bacterium]|jgi:hypothetical protein
MRRFPLWLVIAVSVGPWNHSVVADDPPPIETVGIQSGGVFHVNGKPFFPIMAWLQDEENLEAVKACGMNTTAGYWPGSSDTKNVVEYLRLVDGAGLYGVMPFDAGLSGATNLLGYIHDDEPDLPRQVSDAEITPAGHLRVNSKTPLWKIVDGVTHTWSVLDPLEGAGVTIRPKEPVTVERLALWLTVSPGLAVAKEVSFTADGKEIFRTTLESKKGQQEFSLQQPVKLRALEFKVHSTYPGEQVWGSIGEIEGFDAGGQNVLLAPPRYEPRAQPEKTMEKYRAMKAADPSRPVFLTLTGYFHPHFGKWTDDQRASLYPEYLRATDVVGYDVYPIYGWNKPEWIHLVQEATGRLVEAAGGRPVYAWIETSKGSQWTGPLERQKDVTPRHIRAEVWMALCRGATAIGYFTHVWKPSYRQFGVPEENRAALAEINGQITRLAPAILGQKPKRPVSLEVSGDVKLDLMAREHAGELYLFAVNYDERLQEASATFRVEGLPRGAEVTVVDEGRTIRAEAGSFADVFEPLAVHVYRID